MVKNSFYISWGLKTYQMSLVKVVFCDKLYKCQGSTPNKLETVKHASDSAERACLNLVFLYTYVEVCCKLQH